MPKVLDDCVAAMKRDGKSEENAFAICTARLKKEGKLSDDEAKAALQEHKKKKKKKKQRKRRTPISTGYAGGNVTVQSYQEIKGIEILKAGTIRDEEYKIEDLQIIAENTNRLIEEKLHNPPVKLGHDDEQIFATISGLPAAGWLANFRVKGDKLLADMQDVPKKVIDAIGKKLFRKVSAEVFFDFPHPETGVIMGKVIRAVALLGSEIPEVKGLLGQGLDAFLSERKDMGKAWIAAAAYSDGGEKVTHEALGDITITISAPENENGSQSGGDGMLTAAGLTGSELDMFRQAERVAAEMGVVGPSELRDNPTVDSLMRWVGTHGFQLCSVNSTFMATVEDPRALCEWLFAQAVQFGHAKPEQQNNQEENMTVTQKDLDDANKRADDAEAAAKKSADGVKAADLRLAEGRKKAAVERIETFANAHAGTITPAVKPYLLALAESVDIDKEAVIKLSDNKEEKSDAIGLILKFVEELLKAKGVKLDEEVTKGKKTGKSETISASDATKEGEVADYSDQGSGRETLKDFSRTAEEVHNKTLEYAEKHGIVVAGHPKNYRNCRSAVFREDPSLKEGVR